MSDQPLTDAEALLLHRLLAKYHAAIAEASRVATVHDHHSTMAWRLDSEADRIQDRIVKEGIKHGAHS